MSDYVPIEDPAGQFAKPLRGLRRQSADVRRTCGIARALVNRTGISCITRCSFWTCIYQTLRKDFGSQNPFGFSASTSVAKATRNPIRGTT